MNTSENKSFAYLLVDVTRLLRKHFDRRAAPLGLTRAQWRALKAISRQEGLSQTDLAELLEMETIPIGRVVDRLQQAGFVERRAEPKDRRRWSLYLTDKAHAVVDQMDVIATALRDDAVHGIDSDVMAAFVNALEDIKANLIKMESAS
jgi:MarR family transcriptional regulator, transcriptional regulator for hemolysin